jgi:hypothetical protein
MNIIETVMHYSSWFILDTFYGIPIIGLLGYWVFLHDGVMRRIRERRDKRLLVKEIRSIAESNSTSAPETPERT